MALFLFPEMVEREKKNVSNGSYDFCLQVLSPDGSGQASKDFSLPHLPLSGAKSALA